MSAAIGLLAAGALSGCAPGAFSNGITRFSQAVDAQDSAEQALIQSANEASLREWQARAAKVAPRDITIDLPACAKAVGYKPGDCAVVAGKYGSAPTSFAASTTALKAYALVLAKVASDNSCVDIKTDGAALAGNVGILAKALGGSSDGVSAVGTIVETVACRAIDQYKLQLLRRATASADPIVHDLVPRIEDKDRRMAGILVGDAVAQLSAAESAYQANPSTDQLNRLVALAAAVDMAQALSLDRTIAEIASAHARLTRDLQQEKVDLADVLVNAQSIVDDAKTIEAAIKTIKSSSAAPG